MTTPDNAKMILKVQLLLAQADHPNTDPVEADTYRAKAQLLMQKYRIDEETARQERLLLGIKAEPITAEIVISSQDSAYRSNYYSMFYWIAEHVGVRYDQTWGRIVDEETGQRVFVLKATCVGFDTDIRLLEMIYTGVQLHFSSTLEPKMNPLHSDQENCYNLRNAGVERHRISDLIWGPGSSKISSRNAKVTTLYAAECAVRGEDPKVIGRTVNAKTYRRTFASYYAYEISVRLSKMRAVAGTDSGALVLANRAADVDEAFYQLFPDQRPITAVAKPKEDCARCAAAKSGHCREHPAYRSSAAAPYSATGARAGRSAAQEANLAGASPTPRGRLKDGDEEGDEGSDEKEKAAIQ